MFKTYNLFNNRDLDNVLPEITYYYLFRGLSLTQIESILFNTENYKGWLSKSFLNYIGIDTEGSNKGIYKDRTIPDVVEELYKSKDLKHIEVAKLLKNKYM